MRGARYRRPSARCTCTVPPTRRKRTTPSSGPVRDRRPVQAGSPIRGLTQSCHCATDACTYAGRASPVAAVPRDKVIWTDPPCGGEWRHPCAGGAPRGLASLRERLDALRRVSRAASRPRSPSCGRPVARIENRPNRATDGADARTCRSPREPGARAPLRNGALRRRGDGDGVPLGRKACTGSRLRERLAPPPTGLSPRHTLHQPSGDQRDNTTGRNRSTPRPSPVEGLAEHWS
jgi:hypothetical protein